MKKFNKKFLKEVLDLNEKDVKLTMECQKLFPELLTNEAEKINSARELYLKLKLNITQWSRWSKKNITNNEFFKENIDWKLLDIKTSAGKSRVEGNFAKDFSISVEMAKHLCMMARTKESYKFRQYFILIEKSIRGLQEHEKVRKPEKQTYNEMKRVILEDYSKKHKIVTKTDESYLMIRESNMINKNLIGFTACEIKTRLGYTDRETREHLTIKKNKIITKIQEMIVGLVEMGIEFDTRNEMIKKLCDNKYSYIKEEFLNKTK